MKTNSRILSSVLILVLILSLGSCFKREKPQIPEDLWDNATYTEDTTVGTGAKMLTVVITGGEKSVTLTVKTDADILGNALFELGLIDDASFFTTVNGITADWNTNEAWWKLCENGQQSSVGIGSINISGGESFEIIYTIGM